VPITWDDMIPDEGIMARPIGWRRMITWPKSVLPIVSVLFIVSCCWCLGCNTFMCWVLHAIEVLVIGSSR
jgi:hypothetical protein